MADNRTLSKRQGGQLMDAYTITAAAKLLDTTRQTIYRYIQKEPDRYTTTTAQGRQVITLQGLALLREELQTKPGRAVQHDTAGQTDTGRNHTPLMDELKRLEKVNAVQADELTRLSQRVNELSSKVTDLEADKAFLQTQLDKMVDKIPDTSKRVTFFQKLLGRGNP